MADHDGAVSFLTAFFQSLPPAHISKPPSLLHPPPKNRPPSFPPARRHCIPAPPRFLFDHVSQRSFLERKNCLRKTTCQVATASRITMEKMENHWMRESVVSACVGGGVTSGM